MRFVPYDRQAAVEYAHRWAYGRNPAYYNFNALGGDCTNFASQCLYAGCGVMNFTPTFGWYYLNVNDRTPSWTGVPFFHDFLTRRQTSVGPVAIVTALDRCQPGDFVQLNFSGDRYGHTPVIVQMGFPVTLNNTLVAAHTDDTDYRPLAAYAFRRMRCLHISGVYQEN